MTASRPSPRFGCALALVLWLAAGCVAPAGLPVRSAVDPGHRQAIAVPDVADYTAARLAAAALASQSGRGLDEVERALASLEAIDRVLTASGERPTGLSPAARDLANAALDDRMAYREATDDLLDESVDPGLEARLEIFQDDDLMALAGDRIWDARMIEFARIFNALAEPAARSITNHNMAPYYFAMALIQYAVEEYQEEPLTLQQRQALGLWKQHLERHPEDPRAEEIRARIDEAQAEWNRTYHERWTKQAESALAAGESRLSLVLADRALRYLPEEEQASALRDAAATQLLLERERLRRSVSVRAHGNVAPPGGRELALALLSPDGDPAAVARSLLEDDPAHPLADEARFALAGQLLEAGEEDAGWEQLAELAEEDESNMARHARQLVDDPASNPHLAFEIARRSVRNAKLRHALLGTWSTGPPSRGLPSWLEWALGLPELPRNLAGAPTRLLQLPWARAAGHESLTARRGRLYLARFPEGAHREEVEEWLVGHEEGRGNWLAALELLQESGADPARIAEAREMASLQSLRAALRHPSRAMRIGLLQRIGEEFPFTDAGRAAGHRLRREIEEATPHRISISRDYLEENPGLAGPRGLALRPELLDGVVRNGELHPAGVALLGGRVVEFAFIAPGSHEEDAPETRQEELSEEHLARVVALLEETSFRNALLDPLDQQLPDAKRDRFFDQARLGRTDLIDRRPGASSSYSFRSVRERYGILRRRESILPFDLVMQGSFTDLSLAAFPRMRRPRKTSDAILYE